MKYYAGKALEALGLSITLAALFVGFSTKNTHAELTYLAVGGAVFVVGWILERTRRS